MSDNKEGYIATRIPLSSWIALDQKMDQMVMECVNAIKAILGNKFVELTSQDIHNFVESSMLRFDNQESAEFKRRFYDYMITERDLMRITLFSGNYE